MFINAQPRIVSNGFETFVPIHRAEALHQRLVAMTNNDVNAWSIFRPVASSADDWDHHIDDFNSNENFPVQSLYGGYFHETSAAHAPPVDLPKTISYTTVSRDQGRRTKKASSSQRVHQHRPSDMNCFENPSPMLGNHYSQWSLSRGRGSFAEFSRGGDGLNDFQDLTSMKLDLTSFSGISLGLPQPSHQEENFTAGDSFDVDRTSPSTVYSGYSPACTAFDSQSLVCMDIPGRNNSTNSSWWSGSSRINRDPCQNSIEPPFVSDGLPRYQDDQRQQYSDLWDIGSTDWTSHSMAPNTISPKALTLNVPSAPLSSSGSSQDATLSLSDSSVVPTLDDPAGFSGSETLAVVEQPIPIRRHRQMLPGSPPSSQRAVPVLPSNDFPPSKTNKKRPLEATSGGNSRTKSSPSSSSTIPSTQSSTNKSEGAPAKSSPPKRIEPKPLNPVPNQSWNTSSQSSTTAQAIHHRDAKDDFLVRSKLAGMSYKDIRRQGKFTEAESTLRGRFRTLTKHKAARVRKPEWDDNDLRLLKKAVRKLAHGSDPSKCKVPWKQVAEYIANNGGSYHFGNATCRKRWDELQGQSPE